MRENAHKYSKERVHTKEYHVKKDREKNEESSESITQLCANGNR
jgi:hypothetical protein